MKVIVNWDTEVDGEIVEGPPTTVDVPSSVHEYAVADWLSDTYGFCVFDWKLAKEEA